jgi:alcohol dehydrogenase
VRAVQFESFGGSVVVTDRADPAPPHDGVVIAVESTGLCRSDWHGWQGHDSDITVLPHVPGHELAGRVAAIGADVRAFAIGDRVTVPFVCGCGICSFCTGGDAQVCPDQWQPGFSGPGSFAELVAIPRADFNLIALPESVSMDAAAALGCRFATAYRAVAQVGAVEPGETVVVFGCGGVGLSIIMIAVARGARVIAVDVAPEALAMAGSLGAYAAIRSDSDLAGALRELVSVGADATFDALGSIDTCRAAVESLRPRGRHVQVGLLPPAEVGDRASVPMHRVIGLELSILGSHGMSARGYPEMLALMAQGHLKPSRLITRTLTLDEAPAALETMAINPHPGVSVIHPFAAIA